MNEQKETEPVPSQKRSVHGKHTWRYNVRSEAQKLAFTRQSELTGCLAESLPVTVPVWFHVEEMEPFIS